MNRAESIEYFVTFNSVIQGSTQKDRVEFLRGEKLGSELPSALAAVRKTPTEITYFLQSFPSNRKNTPLKTPRETVTEVLPGTAVLLEARLPEQLTEEQQTILWANRQYNQYQSIDKADSKGKKRAKSLVSQTAKDLLNSLGKIDTAASIWRSEASTGEGSEDKIAAPIEDSFYMKVATEIGQELAYDEKRKKEGRWRELPGEHLASLVKVYAHNPLVKEFVETVLKGYFKGPHNREDRVSALHEFTYGVLDLIEDIPALRQGLLIARFENDSIISRNSSFYMDYCFSLWPDVSNQSSTKKANIVDNILSDLYPQAALSLDELSERIRTFTETDTFTRRATEEVERLVKRVGQVAAERELRTLGEFQQLKGTNLIEGDPLTDRIRANKYFQQTLDSKDPLRAKFNNLIAPRVAGEEMRRVATEIIKGTGQGPLTFLSLSIPPNLILELGLSPSLLRQKKRYL